MSQKHNLIRFVRRKRKGNGYVVEVLDMPQEYVRANAREIKDWDILPATENRLLIEAARGTVEAPIQRPLQSEIKYKT